MLLDGIAKGLIPPQRESVKRAEPVRLSSKGSERASEMRACILLGLTPVNAINLQVKKSRGSVRKAVRSWERGDEGIAGEDFRKPSSLTTGDPSAGAARQF